MFAPLYHCRKCNKDVWHVTIVDEIDTEYDEVYPHAVHEICGSDVTSVLENNQPVYHALSDEEMYWEQFSPFEEEDWEDE